MVTTSDVLLSVLVVLCAIALGRLVHKVRLDSLSPVLSTAITVACGVGLVVMVLSDWPIENLSKFWADHSVLASLVSSLLLVGLVFMVYERSEQRHQAELASGISGAGAGGIVDALVDAEVALALVSSGRPAEDWTEEWRDWQEPGRPLRWLRASRSDLVGDEQDPRTLAPAIHGPYERNNELIGQAIRRLLAAMRDWSPLLSASSEGTELLLVMSQIRADLMAVQRRLGDAEGSDAAETLGLLRAQLRVLALCCEQWSGAAEPRHSVLRTHDPLQDGAPDFGRHQRSLTRRLDSAALDLGFTSREHR